jgi:hypothetical protein
MIGTHAPDERKIVAGGRTQPLGGPRPAVLGPSRHNVRWGVALRVLRCPESQVLAKGTPARIEHPCSVWAHTPNHRCYVYSTRPGSIYRGLCVDQQPANALSTPSHAPRTSQLPTRPNVKINVQTRISWTNNP